MKRALILFAALSTIFQLVPRRLEACRCLPQVPPEEEMAKVDVVFRGRAIAFDPVDENTWQAVFSVRTIWKGPVPADPEAQPDFHVLTASESAACGFHFVPGETYIVYAIGTVDALSTHTCTRTRLDDDVESAALGPPLWQAADTPRFRRSDPDRDGQLSIADAVSVLNYLFLDGFPPFCLDAADSNDDGKIDLSDPVHHLGYLFLGTIAPPAPFPDCGEDATADELSCESYLPGACDLH